MTPLDILSFAFAILSINSLILNLCYLLPRNAILSLAALLNETQQLLDRAEAIGAIPLQGEARAQLDCLANQFMMMRVQSHLARGTFQQLRLAFLRGLTCRVYSLYYLVDAIKAKLELAADKQRLAITERATSTVVPSPIVAAIATTVNNVAEPTLPLPATVSRMSVATSDT